MKNYLLLFLFAFLVPRMSLAQNSLSGKVEAKGNPLEFVTVFLPGLQKGTATDQNGQFTLSGIPNGSWLVEFSLMGYRKESRSISFPTEGSLVISLENMDNSLDEVVVSGTLKEVSKLDSPVPVEVYKSTFFRANPTPSLFESLQNVNGVRPQVNCNVCNTGDIHINGLEGPYTMVLIDGMPIVSGLSTVYGLTGIPQALIDRIEVVKGPASTLYGSEAVGGLINIITKRPEVAPVVGIEMMSSSWGEINADLGFKTTIGQKVQLLSGINGFWYDNPKDLNQDGFTDVTLQKRISLFQKISVSRPKSKVFSLAGRYLYEDRWGGEMDWSKEYRGGDEIYGESIYTKRWELFGTYELPFVSNMNFQFSTNGHRQNSVYGKTIYIANQEIAFGQLTWRKELPKSSWLVGAAYRYTFYDDNTPATGGDGGSNKPSKINLPGVFVQNEWKFSSQGTILFGGRYDQNSLHGGIFSPRVNFKWTSLDKSSVLRLSAGNGFRVANVFTEDHAALTGAREVVFAEELAPEKSWNGNVNYVKKIYSAQGNYIGLDASAFYTLFTNRIVPDYESNPNQIIYSNLDGRAISKGISLNLDAVYSSGLKIMAGATLMDVSLHEGDTKVRQLLTERFSGVWTIGYEFANSGMTVDYTGNVYSPMRLPLLGELDDRPAYSPWYSLQNIQLTKKFGEKWEVFGGVKNLLNFTPPANSIARSFDPFDRGVEFDTNGMVIPTPENPNALTFDPTYVFAPNQGIRGFLGLRLTIF